MCNCVPAMTHLGKRTYSIIAWLNKQKKNSNKPMNLWINNPFKRKESKIWIGMTELSECDSAYRHLVRLFWNHVWKKTIQSQSWKKKFNYNWIQTSIFYLHLCVSHFQTTGQWSPLSRCQIFLFVKSFL